MKILITGGAGFIGSNLVERYASNNNNQVTIIDNLSTGNVHNIIKYINQRNVEFIEKDICDSDITDFIVKNKFDYIYNLACPASPYYYLKHPVQTWETNVLGVRNILNGIKGSKTKLIQSSTSEVYGCAKEIPQKENYWGNVNCIGVRACYDEGKRAAETLIFDYKRLFGVNAVVVRIFNTYGPKMDKNDGRIVSNFINQAINNKEITIYGKGKQTRSFCYIEDTVDALIGLMNKNEMINCPVNIGNPKEIKVKDIAKLIKKITNSSSKIVYYEPMKDDPPRRKPNIEYLQYLLKWRPKVNLEDGLRKCIQYYKEDNKKYEEEIKGDIKSRVCVS